MNDNLDENKQKGDAFEKWVVKKFDRDYFQVEEWRSDKYVDGIYPVSNHFPDLEISFSLPGKDINKTFAVECKWRKNLYKGGINWAEEYQVKNYAEYAAMLKIPVFVILGVGGEPDKPESVYIIPLQKLQYKFCTGTYLNKFRHINIDKNFFYDFEKSKLL
ncbi:MAG: hypothetical protein PHR81_04500 [Bacteroidales bacterium]|jgi:hypothetical protein|nr:hypothetical protein [Bacteroidales bacterium]MDD4214051.1 hypothetical protein [Bacteroidales bacterium]